jgi:3-oxoacyl-[acyl-carrier protein] reductase
VFVRAICGSGGIVSKEFLVVGGTLGIVAALSHQLAGRGHRVTQLFRHPEHALDHPVVISLAWDARSADLPADRLPTVVDGLAYGPGSIRLRPFDRFQRREWLADADVNLLGAIRAIQGSLKALCQSEFAAILLFSTVVVGAVMPFHAAVTNAKGAVEGRTRALAAELEPHIRVNALAPTVTDTPLGERLIGNPERRAAAAERHSLMRVAEPAHLAHAAVWLLDEAQLTTGQVIPVDGGLSSLRVNPWRALRHPGQS